MNIERCIICLEKYSTVSLGDSDEYNTKWSTKLQYIAPEVEWLEDYLICESCKGQLEQAWGFKKFVLNLEVDRRLQLTKKEIYPTEINSDFKDNCDIDYYYEEKNVACEECSKMFTTLTQLQQHKLQIHSDHSFYEGSPQYEDDIPTHTENDDSPGTVNNVLFTCYDCDVGFKTKDDLLYHVENDHGQAILCLVCETLCSNRVVLDRHMKDEHKIQISKEFACSICSKKFGSDSILSEHIKLCGSKFSCGKCREVYSTKKLLNAHAKLCKKQKPAHQCSSCNKFYTSERNLSLHNFWCTREKQRDSNHDSKLNYTCDICIIKFESLEEYDSHNITSHDTQLADDSKLNIKKRRGRRSTKIFTCEKCSEQFDYVKSVVGHCVSVHGMEEKHVKAYSCTKCEMRFASSANLDQHHQYHEQKRTHICSLCGKGFITKSDLTVHEYTHYNRRNYKCGQCGKAFNTNKNLRTHNLVVHTDRSLWKYGCTVCEKRFPLKTNFEQHLRRHAGEKKYICHICRKAFISKSEMQRHINLHSNIKAFKCSQCDKEYKERRTYEAHLKKIHDIGNAKLTVREKKFVCHICPSQFYDKQKLSRHLCGHSGLKPFPCHACNKKFTDKSYLKHHLKVAHSVMQLLNEEEIV